MRRLSIKSRVALWYAFSMLAFLLLVVALLLAAGDQLVSRERKSNLMTVTDRAVDDVRILNGKMSTILLFLIIFHKKLINHYMYGGIPYLMLLYAN